MLTGCVRTYQPLAGLHDPRVVDPSQPNFQDVRLDVYCVPDKDFKMSEALVLCQRVAVLFENQGAVVETYAQDPLLQAGDGGLEGPGSGGGGPADLVVELRTEQVQSGYNPVSYTLAWATITLVPAVREASFTQKVTVRAPSGFLLARSTFRGKVVERFGVGTWVGNKTLDLLVREPEDELAREDSAGRDLSADLYGQLSQVVFNAHLRMDALRLQAPVSGAPR